MLPFVRTDKPDLDAAGVVPLRMLLRLLYTADGRRRLRRRISRKIYPYPSIRYFNDAVNPELGVIYVAIPKSGSTTIREQISPVPYLDDRYLVQTPHLDLLQIKHGLLFFEQYMALDANRTFPHTVPSTLELEAAARLFFDNAFKFSTVRNPWARAVSLYSRKEGVQVSGEISFAQFIERHECASDTCRSSTLHRNQLDWLTDETGEIAVDYVFRIEDMDQKLNKLKDMSKGRVDLAAQRRANVNTDSKSGCYRNMYDDRLRKLVAQRFEKDIDWFKYTF